MLYIYAALFLSSILCVTGVVLSLVNLQKYNFGLYVALLSIVTFTIALAFFVVKPKVCLGPRWFSKLFSRNGGHGGLNRRGNLFAGEGDNSNEGQRRLMFFGFNTAAFFRSEFETVRDSGTILQQPTTTKFLDFAPVSSRFSNPLTNAGVVVSNPIADLDFKINHLDDGPSTTLIPPTPPSFEENDFDDDDQVTPVAEIDQNDDRSRVRAWTFTCSTTMSHENQNENEKENSKKNIDSAECWRQWQKILFRESSGLLLRTSFPLSERTPFMIYSGNRSSENGDSQKSWSTEEVVNLNEFLDTKKKSKAKKSASTEKTNSTSPTSPSSTQPGDDLDDEKPLRKNALTPSDNPHSWRRSRTITVKYVPVKEEWIAKPISVLSGGMYRKKSRSTNAMLSASSDGGSSNWWSLTNLLFQRGSSTGQQQHHLGARQHVV